MRGKRAPSLYSLLTDAQPEMTADFEVLFRDAVKYKFLPYSIINPFIGIGIGLFGAFRIGPNDSVFDASGGPAIMAGIEHYLGNSLSIEFQAKWTGYAKLLTQEIGGTEFHGGELGGFHYTIGICYNW